jgi:inositol-hexakisphosphate kinase
VGGVVGRNSKGIMPPALHPHLKRGLDYDDCHTDPEDRIEDLPAELLDPEQRTAKRRRIEAIAAQYLRGRPPVILTAALRGPFNNGWKNPWADNDRKKKPVSDKSNATVGSRSQHGKRATTSRREPSEGTGSAKVRRSRGNEAAKDIVAPQVASPEAPRATESTLPAQEEDSLDHVEVPPATAPLPDEDTSSATEFFSANTDRTIQNQSSLKNPFWLRRPESARVNMRKATNENTHVSPTRTRSRDGHSQTHKVAELRLSLPKEPIRTKRSPEKVAVPEHWRSSASASMVFSSPAKTMNMAANYHVDGATPTTVVKRPSPNKPEKANTPKTAITHVATHNTGTGQCAQQTTVPITSSLPSHRRSSREDLQQSADPATSPVPASSTGFVYKKMAESKREGENPPKPKPRAVDFNSSPALKEKVPIILEQPPQNMATIQESGDAPREDVTKPETIVEAPQEADGDTTVMQDQSQELRTSRGSDWSTQGAMLLAQLEFQESTFPTVSPEASRMWSKPLRDSPRPMSAVPSPATTPLSILNTEQDELLPSESILQDAPISTQDLFGAASPFAFSTVKKKPEGLGQSNLRFALSPTDNEGWVDCKKPHPVC